MLNVEEKIVTLLWTHYLIVLKGLFTNTNNFTKLVNILYIVSILYQFSLMNIYLLEEYNLLFGQFGQCTCIGQYILNLYRLPLNDIIYVIYISRKKLFII